RGARAGVRRAEGGGEGAGGRRATPGGRVRRGPADRRAGAGPAAGLGGRRRGGARLSADRTGRGDSRMSIRSERRSDDADESDADSPELTAVQAALAAEHAAVYGYGALGGRLDGKRGAEARAAYD